MINLFAEFFFLATIVFAFISVLITFSKFTNKTIKRLDQLEDKLDNVMKNMDK